MTRPDAAADGSVDPAPAPTPGPGVPTHVLLLAVGATATIAARSRADAQRPADGAAGTSGDDLALTAEADAVAATATRLATELADRGVDVDAATAPLGSALARWDGARPSRDAAEALVGGRLARGLVADLTVGLTARPAAPPTTEGPAAPLTGVDDPLVASAAAIVADALTDPRTRDRLALLTRRMLGDALVLVDALLAALPEVASAVEAGDGGRRALVKRVKSAHGRRVGALGL